MENLILQTHEDIIDTVTQIELSEHLEDAKSFLLFGLLSSSGLRLICYQENFLTAAALGVVHIPICRDGIQAPELDGDHVDYE